MRQVLLGHADSSNRQILGKALSVFFVVPCWAYCLPLLSFFFNKKAVIFSPLIHKKNTLCIIYGTQPKAMLIFLTLALPNKV